MADRDTGTKSFPRLASWQGNALVFGILFLVVVAYFMFQVQNAHRMFIKDAENHARLVADIIRVHARGTVLSEQIIRTTLKTFLGNTTRFVKYLNAIEPFDSDELTAFAKESGLAGISIFYPDGTAIHGPRGWLDGIKIKDLKGNRLLHFPDRHLIVLASPLNTGKGYVAAGIRAEKTELLQKEIGLPQTFRAMEQIEGIRYIRLDKNIKNPAAAHRSMPGRIKIIKSGKDLVAEIKMPLDIGLLTVGLDAQPLEKIRRDLWRDFIIFSILLAILGSTLSWFLYRHQARYVNQVKEYERQISRQREEASLGRAAASIAHEIRNPLNAMAMGLQRLKIEATCLSGEQKRLIDIVLDSLKRTNGIVTGLLRYAGMSEPSLKLGQVDLMAMISDAVTLYEKQMEQAGIRLEMDLDSGRPVTADPDLLSQVLDNLLRNAMEAQPRGGFIHISLKAYPETMILTMRNGGHVPRPDQAGQLLEPYFTTKTRGTGLGLAVSNRIVRAHGGKITLNLRKDVFEVKVELPLNGQHSRKG